MVPSAAVCLVAIDSDTDNLAFIQRALAQDGVAILTATTAAAALDLIVQERPQIVLLEMALPGTGGLEMLDKILDIDPGIAVMLMTADYSTDSAVEAIRRGAYDYLTKPLCIDRLRGHVEEWLGDARQRRQILSLDRQLTEAYQFEGMVGRSPLMLDVFSRVRRIAQHFQTVLVTGETGTGKELAAKALHRLSPAAGGPFVVCNSTAIVDTLFESELFGYVKGSFTGASQDRPGFFEHADTGTLFLDEIGELPLGAQAKLLRVLQNQEIQRVGSPAIRKVDVRVIAATNKDLRGLVAQKRFRDDLYYRLSMVEIGLPRLAARKEDLPLLQRHFIESFAARYNRPIRGITRRAQALLARYSWPGNVRELENILGYACMMSDRDLIDVRDLPERLRTQVALPPTEEDGMWTLEEVQLRHARRVLERVGGNRVRAAEILGISRATLYRLLPKKPASTLLY